MTGIQPRVVWDDVADRIGEDLRAVVRYEATDFESILREDVRSEYSGTELRSIVDRTIVTQLSAARDEETFRAGDLEGIVRAFDDAWFLAVPDPIDPKAGVLISVDRHGESASDGDIEWCLSYLEEAVPTAQR
ncbi:hypothetical protein [Halobiforma nitratireducens]|uniref:Uncharacterized protein n=1 Tax=Halobiforma nitratireducens JCM 10879 TaxID=1227454 RepID=M0LUF4_9EURY|nr:hypothetical protein [Halobiforma nitratireducens]EMA36803.1 hypothetical protein C446_11362 [Halobiforma nitratireducens JCM 10879]